jgi:S-(hydroxymethyl)glutathione dehydrogenase/alcohol dehydrogenase
VRAAVLKGFSRPLEICDVSSSDPGPGDIKVAIAAAGICHSDILAQRGDSERAVQLPLILGHEGAGTVVEVGSSVTSLRPGDEVALTAASYCGRCRWCQVGHQQHCLAYRSADAVPRIAGWVGDVPVRAFVGVGTFSEVAVLDQYFGVKLPDGMPLRPAALLGCAVHTGIGAVRHTARVAFGESVVVLGCGGVGLNIIQGAKLAGAAVIVAVDLHDEQLARAERFGATHIVNACRGDAVEAVRELSRGGTDHAFDVVGSSGSVGDAIQMVGTRGKVTVVGLGRPSERLSFPIGELFHEKSVQGSKLGRQAGIDIERYCQMYLSGQLMLDELITHTVSLDEANAGLDAFQEGSHARVLFDVEP